MKPENLNQPFQKRRATDEERERESHGIEASYIPCGRDDRLNKTLFKT